MISSYTCIKNHSKYANLNQSKLLLGIFFRVKNCNEKIVIFSFTTFKKIATLCKSSPF